MSRPIRNLKPTFIIFCEGDTELNYFNGMKKKDDLAIFLKPINMKGGGYNNFLKELKKSSNSNSIAKFVIIDLDVLIDNINENKNLYELINYCKKQNRTSSIPIFIIINNPDFEYIACLHSSAYKNQQCKEFIEKKFNYKNLDKFKSDKNVYTFLTSKDNSINNMLSKLNCNKYIKNKYSIKKKTMDIKIDETIINKNNTSQKGSNINEFFEILNKFEF